MASQEFAAFEQFLDKRPQSSAGERLLMICINNTELEMWAYVAHDALGLLVKKDDDASPTPTLYFFPWNSITQIA
jgi:hypothetical protein